MAAHIQIQCTKTVGVCVRDGPQRGLPSRIHFGIINVSNNNNSSSSKLRLRISAVDRSNVSGDDSGSSNSNPNNSNKKKGGVSSASAGVPSSNYVVPLEKTSSITRPLNEILRDLNKRIPDNIIRTRNHGRDSTFIPWFHANRMLSFYAPGWCGEIRDVIFSDNGTVTVVYRVTIRGSDDEAYRESTGTVSSADGGIVDPVAAAEEIAFCRACARFGLGLYLYHEE